MSSSENSDSRKRKGVSVGDRIKVWWPEDERYYTGTLTGQRGKRFSVEYDDGEAELLDLTKEDYLIILSEENEDALVVSEFSPPMNQSSTMSTLKASDSRKRKRVSVGDRIKVWWPEDEQYYTGTLSGQRGKQVFVEYNDGDEELLDLAKEDYVVLLGEENNNALVVSEIERVAVGSRLSDWWPLEKKFFDGTVQRILVGHNTPFFIVYDDGDQEWVNLRRRKFKIMNQERKSNKDLTSPRILEDGQGGDEEEHQKKRARPSIAKGQKEDREGEDESQWSEDDPVIDFASKDGQADVGYNSSSPSSVDSSDDNKGRNHPPKKRESREARNKNPAVQGAEDRIDSHQARESGKPRPDEPVVDVDPLTGRLVATSRGLERAGSREDSPPEKKKSAKFRNEQCHLCKAEKMKRPTSLDCCHLFCKSCIKDHCGADRTCPVCQFPLPLPVKLRNQKKFPDAFRGIDKICMRTGSTLETFTSASATSLKLNKSSTKSALHIIDACRAKTKTEKEHRGFFWKFQDSGERVLRVDEGIKDGIPIEQVDLESGKVVEVFPSSRKASEKTGIGRIIIRRVLERRGKANGGGYFWRFMGETHGPWPDPEPTNIKPVEQISLETGNVVATYSSLSQAKMAMGMRMNSSCIRNTCDGHRMQSKGFFWRWAGSDCLPPKFPKKKERILVRKSKMGSVIKEFRLSHDAARWIGVDFSAVCRWCREGRYARGYYWSYWTRPKISDANKIVGRRLRLLTQDGEWREGKVASYNTLTTLHSIQYDIGESATIDLSEATYEWKNDQGQKPVEKLCHETRELLARFDSITDAATDLGVGVSQIHQVLRGSTCSCRGFFYRFEGSSDLPKKLKTKKIVQQLCLKTGRVLATFESIKEAGIAVGITTPGISYCCNGRNGSKSAGGYGWQFAEEEEG